MISLNLPPEWLPDIEKAIDSYAKMLGRYINKSSEDIYRIERYQLILQAIQETMLAE